MDAREVKAFRKHAFIHRPISEKADFDAARVLEIEETVQHDVIAFLTNMAEYIGPESRWVHLGMTSSDLLDTMPGRCSDQPRRR